MDAQGGVVVDRVDEVNCVSCHQKLDVSGLPSFSEFNCPHCNANQRIPAQFGTFVLLERLGSGGMGVVYRAYDQKLGRFVALKVMKHLGHDEDFEQFCREAQATAQLNHPNVVQIYNFDQDQRLQPYIVMELVSEGRLDDKIAGGRQLDEVSALKTHIDVAKGLQAANPARIAQAELSTCAMQLPYNRGHPDDLKGTPNTAQNYMQQVRRPPPKRWARSQPTLAPWIVLVIDPPAAC